MDQRRAKRKRVERIAWVVGQHVARQTQGAFMQSVETAWPTAGVDLAFKKSWLSTLWQVELPRHQKEGAAIRSRRPRCH